MRRISVRVAALATSLALLGGASAAAAPAPLLNKTDHIAYMIGYEDGTFRPGARMTRAQTAVIFYRLLTPATLERYRSVSNPFLDVQPDAWYNAAVSTLLNLGIIQGRSPTVFDPEGYVTRAELIAMAARFDRCEADYVSKDPIFTDTQDHWARGYIDYAADQGWVTGYGQGLFAPQSDVIRAEGVTIINRLLGRTPVSEDGLLADRIHWPDCDNPNQWFYLHVQEATNGHSYQIDEQTGLERWTALKSTD